VSLGASMEFSKRGEHSWGDDENRIGLEGEDQRSEDHTMWKKEERTVTTPILPCSYAK
jgi:hypothetical protein